MKHLIHISGGYFVVGLGDRVFLGRSDSDQPQLCELKEDEENGIKEGTPNAAKETEKGKASEKATTKSQPQSPSIPNEVQAVVLTTVPSADGKTIKAVWCAVSRINKKISVFEFDPNALENGTQSIGPTIVHSTAKRVHCLEFASIGEGDSTVRLVLGGDLAGDLYAFDLEKRRRRLLLGHTATMLTGVQCDVVRNRVLTSDRDEKIRVSSFPRTQIVEGFLLGHTAYITSMDMHAENSLVVSCDGDGMIRMWNIDSMEQMDEISTRPLFEDKKEESESLGMKIIEKDDKENDQNVSDIPASDQGTTGENNRRAVFNTEKENVPIGISLNALGTKFAVIFDFSTAVAFYEIKSTADRETKLKLTSTVQCKSQPLAISFLTSGAGTDEQLIVLTCEPDYVTILSPEEGGTRLSLPASFASLVEQAKAQSITTPVTALEKDEYGNIKMKKLSDARGPSASDAPWNRAERIDVARERGRRAKKRRQERYKQTKDERKEEQKQ